MPQMTAYEHGVPSWIDIGSPDIAASLAFYSGLFGWSGEDQGEEAGHYTICSLGGKMVAAIGPAQSPGPPFWTTYVNVDDLDTVTKNVEAAGGTVVVPPMQVMSAGRMAVYQDTTGAFISAWQPGDHKGAELVNEPGTFSWCELATGDMEKSKAFYSAAFGWGWGGADEYAEPQVSGRTIAGVRPRGEMPAEVPDNWLVYFGSADLDGDIAKAQGLGATLMAGPIEIPGTGRFGVLVDPQGAVFALFQ